MKQVYEDFEDIPFSRYVHVIFYDDVVIGVTFDDTTVEMLKQQDSRYHTEEVRLV